MRSRQRVRRANRLPMKLPNSDTMSVPPTVSAATSSFSSIAVSLRCCLLLLLPGEFTICAERNQRVFLMTARKARLPRRLEEVEDEFVGLWRQMSALWGIRPTMAEIHG